MPIKRYNGTSWDVIAGDGVVGAQGADGTAPLTTKGDLLTRTSSAVVRQGVGSDGQVLTADSTQANGIKWASPASMVLLSTTSITNTSTINVSVSSGYKKLVVYIENFRPTNANDTLLFRFNGDSGSNYDQFAYQPNYGILPVSHPDTQLLIGQVNNINSTSNGFLVMELPNYDSTIATKVGTAYLSAIYGSSTNIFTHNSSFAYKSTSAIATLNLGWGTGTWQAQGTIKVYGVN